MGIIEGVAVEIIEGVAARSCEALLKHVLKVHFLDFHLKFSPENREVLSEELEENFSLDKRNIKQGFSNFLLDEPLVTKFNFHSLQIN